MFQKKRNTFHGGVHPYEGKELSKDKPIVKAQPGNLLYYAVSQHIGAPCVPVVVAGQTISEGALVGQMPENSLGARIHASIEGIVTEVTDRFVVIKKGGGQ